MSKWYDLARGERGTKEAPGAADNPVVVKYYEEAGHPEIKHDSVAWCAAFVNAMLARSNIRGTGSLAARSFLKWGSKLTSPVTGCIVVFKRGNSSWQGHVAFFVSETRTHIQVLGGNQSNAVNVRSFPKSKFLGYRWPAGVEVKAPTAPKAPKVPKEPKPIILRNGSTGWRVTALQERLKALGYHVRPDGHFGQETARGVVSFQLDAGIAKDGQVGPETQGALDTATPVDRTARADQTKKEVREGSRIMQAASAGKKISLITGVLGGAAAGVQEKGLLGGAQSLVDQGNQARGLIGSFTEFLGWATNYWWILIPVVALAFWWQAHKAENARYEDEVTGKTS